MHYRTVHPLAHIYMFHTFTTLYVSQTIYDFDRHYLHTNIVCEKNATSSCYFLNNSVKNELILIACIARPCASVVYAVVVFVCVYVCLFCHMPVLYQNG